MAKPLQKLAEQAYRIAKRKPITTVNLPRTGRKIPIRKGALTELAKRAGGWDKRNKRIKKSWLLRLKTRLQAAIKRTKRQDVRARLRDFLGMIMFGLNAGYAWRKTGRRS